MNYCFNKLKYLNSQLQSIVTTNNGKQYFGSTPIFSFVTVANAHGVFQLDINKNKFA